MGCHTWFYREIERTQEEAAKNCLKKLKEARNLGWKLYNDPQYYNNDWVEWYGLPNAKAFRAMKKKHLAVLNRQIRMVSKGLCRRAVWNRQGGEHLTTFVDDKGLYIEDTGYHDLFRVYDYPENELWSLEETLEFIQNPENNCSVYDYTEEKVRKFWEEYPDAFIIFR